jgi:thermostable 8-oxoguanine DNA glycosylase
MPINFNSKEDVLALIYRADDYLETVDLIKYFRKLKTDRNPLYLDLSDLEKVLTWKLRRQYWRQFLMRKKNTDEIIQKITKLAFEIEHDDKDYETELKINILRSLDGVEVPIASAILALVHPDKYAVIDFRVWRQIFNEKKSSYTTNDYLKYLRFINELCIKFELHPQLIDMAIWQYDNEFITPVTK